MNKYLKGAIIGVIVVGVILLALFASGKDSVSIITSEDYKEISKSEGFVYYGPEEELTTIKSMAKDLGVEVGFYNSDEYENKDLKEETFYQYKDGKVTFKYSGDLNDYKFAIALMEEDIMDRTYITISLDDYKEIIKEDGYHFMFIGSESCGYCTEFKSSLSDALVNYDFNAYYIDISSLSEDEHAELIATDDYFEENEWGTPLNFLYKDGKRIDVLSGYVPTNELVQFLQKNKVI